MGDADKELRIKLTMSADTSGGKAVKGELNDLSDKTKAYIKTLEEADKKEVKGNYTKGETRRAIREVGRELPILGELGRLAMNPLIGAFVLLSAAVKGAFEGIKQLGERSTPEMEGLTDAIKEQKDAMDELELATESYERALARIGQARETATEKSKAALDVIKDHGGKEIELTDKKHDLASANLEEAEKLGLVTHEQYIAKKLALDEQYAQARLKIEKSVAMAEQVQKYAEYQNLYGDSHEIEAGLAAKRAAAAKAAGAAKFTAGKGKTDEDNLNATEDKIKELEKEGAEIHDINTGLGSFTTLTPQYFLRLRRQQNDAEYAAALETKDKLQRKIKQDEDAKNSTGNTANAAKEDLDADEARLKQNRERMHALETELPRGDTKLHEDNAQKDEIERIESATRSAKAVSEVAKDKNPTGVVQDVADQIQAGQRHDDALAAARDTQFRSQSFVNSLTPDKLAGAGAAAEAMSHGQKIGEDQKALIDSLGRLLGVTHSNGKEILKIIKDGHQGQEGMQREIQELRRAVGQIGTRHSNPGPWTVPG